MLSNICYRNLFITSRSLLNSNQFLDTSWKFSTSRLLWKKEKKGRKCLIFKKKERIKDKKLQIVKFNDKNDFKPLLEPACKVAIVLGGASGYGFEAANYLLCNGAQGIILVDDCEKKGKASTEKLQNSFGQNRAHFYQCDIRHLEKLDGILAQTMTKHKSIHILFNDLDKDRPLINKCNPENEKCCCSKITELCLKYLSNENDQSGGLIVNCASILGFMGWPTDLTPVYCKKEPIIENTIELSKKHPEAKTGVRIVALCPTNRDISNIGIPDFPNNKDNNHLYDIPCIPTSYWKVGTALSHVMYYAKSGSVWVMQPDDSLCETPTNIQIPESQLHKF